MYVATIPNRSSPPAILLREGYREGGKVKNRTLANLSQWPAPKVDLLRRLLREEALAPVDALFEVVASTHHGHVQAVRTTMQRVGFAALLGSRPSRERDLVVAMVAARILEPDSKLATTRWWHTTTLPADLGVSDADEDAYEAMDCLSARIEQLAARHLRAGGFVLYDLSSSYFEGTTCPLAAFGHNRDGKKGKLQVNYGLLTDGRGCPVAVSVFKGNTGDAPTLLPAVRRVRERFGIEQLVVVGDRGMISPTQITALQGLAGVAWLTALKTGAIRDLVAGGHVQLGLFDERNLFELTHPDFPGERLVACRNPELAKLRAHKRQALLAATVKDLDKVRGMVARGTLKGREAIGVRIGKVVNDTWPTHPARHSGRPRRVPDRRAAGRRGSGIGRHLRHSDQRAGGAPRHRRCGAPLQAAQRCRTRLPLAQGHRSQGPADPTPARGAGARPHLSLSVGLLRRVAHARGLATAPV
jgi:hypothetical protein